MRGQVEAPTLCVKYQLSGQVSALNLFGLILGPFLPGFFNDYLFKNSSAARRKILAFCG
jgi:hypothetical protein